MASTKLTDDAYTTGNRGAKRLPAPPQARTAIGTRSSIVVFALVALFSILSMLLERHSEGVAVIWLSNGLLFGFVVRKSKVTWPFYAVLGCAADIAGSMSVGESVFIATISSLANSLEIFLAAWLLVRWFGSPVRLSRPRPLFAFLIVGVLFAPAIASIPSVAWLNLHNNYPFWTTFRTVFLGDALGMAIIAPLTYVVLKPGFFRMFERRALGATLLVLTAPVFATAFDFSQGKEPVLFFLVPAVVFVAFRLGFPGTVVAIFLTFCIAIPLTVSGHGPLMLSFGTNMLHKIVVVQIVTAIALFTAFPIAALLEERAALEQSLLEHEAQLVELTRTDPLTGQANRRAFDESLEAEWQRAADAGLPLALLSIDIDHFKPFNDIYGHPAGDDCLRRIAALASQVLPEHSTARLYRLGGEEFAVLFPGADSHQAHTLAELIRQTVFSARIEHTGNPLGRHTISVGAVAIIPTPDQTARSLLALSDQALYAAKHNGRNRCEAAA